MKLISGADMARSVREIAPSRIAASGADPGWRAHIDAGSLTEVVVAPGDADPAVLAELAARLGWDNVHFLDSLRARIYLGRHAAIANINLDTALPQQPADAGFMVDQPEMVAQLERVYQGYRDQAMRAYPSIERKQERLAALHIAHGRELAAAALARAVAIARAN